MLIRRRLLWFLFGSRLLLRRKNMMKLILGNLNMCPYMCRNLLRILFLLVFLHILLCSNLRLMCRLLFGCFLHRPRRLCIVLRYILSMTLGFRLCNMCLIVMHRSSCSLHLRCLGILMMGCRSNLLRNSMLHYYRLLTTFLLFLIVPIILLLCL